MRNPKSQDIAATRKFNSTIWDAKNFTAHEKTHQKNTSALDSVNKPTAADHYELSINIESQLKQNTRIKTELHSVAWNMLEGKSRDIRAILKIQ